MNSRERFLEVMRYGRPDRVPYFEEGIRKEVLKAWRKQGLPRGAELSQMFPTDRHEEMEVDVDPHPTIDRWPATLAELDVLRGSLNPYENRRLPEGFSDHVRAGEARDYALMLRVHRGFFLSMGVYGWGVQKQPMKGNFVAQDLDLTLSPPPTEGFIPVHHA